MPTQRQLFLDHLAQTSDTPLMLDIESAEGVYLKDTSGKKYIDLIAGIGVSNVGHRHPVVTRAIKDQVDKHLHLMVYGEYIQSPQVKLAKALSDTLPEKLNSVYLVNSGSEAIEGAIKLSKRFSGRTKIISCKRAYHGATSGALSVTGNEDFKRSFRPLLPDVFHIEFNNLNELELIDNQTAAVIVETVQGEAGVRVAQQNFLKEIREKCSKAGTLLILDEIQCGFGRTGKFWAFEHYGITPDIVVSAKGMGGGMPIGCFMANREVMHSFTSNPVLGHITTFGGHPVSSAASIATIEVIQSEALLDSVPEKEALFKKLLANPKIKEIRSLGLMMAVEFESYEVLKPIIDRAIQLGVVTDWFLFNDRSMRIAPPLTISNQEIEEACRLILKAIG